ncbi:transcriptional regulator [Streptomyces alfalfae]|uniref:Transcriptional regulator n=1 Tax=Streptomyces alfalfae TaxID=1642299 RepID=A0ABM6GNY1_9ACTN|nr:helix-turn-helix domain-containing protein [Streptomyces alfalfae]AYA15968.1 transcriptional regulator [Streptomyces fradiae]APY85613.1 transcriptional regulator [Streptomyces alfalfae]QUI34660.1 helix-turn-helix transcriptional regulator [Streptomyces alfalfae]RXX39441.1 transcriptional regulator [Streptomyces alfalfae]RZM83736.1 transcriptional regulator [Streptomyces alfalfae]
MPPQPRPSARSRRSYDQYCAVARGLDAVGDRWTLLIARELLAGPRRYTDLHADLPGVSTDVLASRLKDMEQQGLVTRRKLPPPSAAYVYELTGRGHELQPVLSALAAWGAPALAERRPTDAVRAHWFALPLLRALAGAGAEGVAQVRLAEGEFHVRVGGEREGFGDGPAPEAPDVLLALDAETCVEVGGGALTVGEGVRRGRIELTGDGVLAKALRET